MKFKRYLLRSFPSSTFPEDLSCFELKNDAEIDEQSVPEGYALLKIYWTSIDPLLRTWISGAKSYLDPVKPGCGVPGFGIAKVIKISPDPKKKTIIEEGDWVGGMLEWSEYMLINYVKIHKLPIVPLFPYLGPRRAAIQISDGLWADRLHLLLVHQEGNHPLPDTQQKN